MTTRTERLLELTAAVIRKNQVIETTGPDAPVNIENMPVVFEYDLMEGSHQLPNCDTQHSTEQNVI